MTNASTNNWNLKENVTDLEDSKLLKEHGIDLGVADGYWVYNDIKSEWMFWTPKNLHDFQTLKENTLADIEYWGAYRLDKLRAKLPEWCFGDDLLEDILEITFIALRFDRHITTDEDFNLAAKVKRLLEIIMGSRGQQAIKACVELLILLKKEDLL